MTPQEIVLFLLLQGYTFDEIICVIECTANIAVAVSKSVDGIIANMCRLQAADEGISSE